MDRDPARCEYVPAAPAEAARRRRRSPGGLPRWRGAAGLSRVVAAVAIATAGLASLVAGPKPSSAATTTPLYEQALTIDNAGNPALTDFQVKVTLDSTNFDFAAAAPGGADLRLFDSDGTTPLSFWIQSYDAATEQATLWVKVPDLQAGASKTIYMTYGDQPDATSSSDGNATFPFFDNFASTETTAPGYYALTPEQTLFSQDQAFETSAPHSFSAVELDSTYKYYAYYGPVSYGYVGLAGSNDMVTWTKLGPVTATNEDFASLQVRWPSVVRDGDTLWVALTEDYGSSSHIGLYSTTVSDPAHLTRVGDLVTPQGGGRDQNPNLWYDANDQQYYLYWYSNSLGGWSILAREAPTPEGLASAANIEVLHSSSTLAAPNMLFLDGTYFLATEINGSPWQVEVFASTTSPVSGFTPLPDGPQLPNDSACPSQNVVGQTLYLFTCKLSGGTWTLDEASADLSGGRQQVSVGGSPDATRWTATGGTWTTVPVTLPDGSDGWAVQGTTSTSPEGHQQLVGSYSGSSYVLEADGRQISGRVWGLGVGETSATGLDSVNLYDDLPASANLYLYHWVASHSASTVANTALGAIAADTWYHLTVRVNGTGVGVALDGSPVLQASDPNLGAGAVALYGEDGTQQFAQVFVRAYAPADPPVSVGPLTKVQTITFPAIADQVVGAPDFDPGATASSGLPVSYTAGPAGVCSVTATNLVHIVGAGDCTVTASQAGNTWWAPAAPVSQSFTIALYAINGFLAPVGNTPAVNNGHAGRTYPLKFQLSFEGQSVTSLDAITSIGSAAVSCSTLSASTDLTTTSTGGTSLRYDSTADQYIYNWQTPSTPGCYQVTVTFATDQHLSALFDLS